MAERPIRWAPRFARRQFGKGAANITKTLSELITNADDSYRRLEQLNVADHSLPTRFGEILIEFDRPSRTFRVIDQAEGLSLEEMIDRFEVYGEDSGDRARGFRTRSLFGQGLGDVLFFERRGVVRSIKSGATAVCKFKWRDMDEPVIDPRPGPPATDELRAKWGVAKNGTVVEFRLDDGAQLPQHGTLVQRLSNFYMLRRINGDPSRRIRLITKYPNERCEEAEIRYFMPEGELLQTIHTSLHFEDMTLEIEGEVRRSDRPITQGEATYEEREGGLLVLDENDAVLDLTLFGYDTNPYAGRLFGTLRLRGLGELIRRKLNSPIAEELLTDSREGFDRKTEFSKMLQRAMNSVLKPLVRAEEVASTSSTERRIPPEVRARHDKAFCHRRW